MAGDLPEPILLGNDSTERYLLAYRKFLQWQTLQNTDSFDEKVVLAYFREAAKTKKPTTLWSSYSMLKATFISNHNVNIGEYRHLSAFLREKNEGYQSNKSTIFTAKEIQKFLLEAPEPEYLGIKTALVFAICGVCRIHGMACVVMDNVNDYGTEIVVRIPSSKTKMLQEEYRIENGALAEIVRKYMKALPIRKSTERFFLQYKGGIFTFKIMGKRIMALIPKLIAEFLELPEPTRYTALTFRKNAQMLAEIKTGMDSIHTNSVQNSTSAAEDQALHIDTLEKPTLRLPESRSFAQDNNDDDDDNANDEYEVFEKYDNKIPEQFIFTENERKQICELTIRQMENRFRHYTGISQELSCVVKLINEKCGVSKRNLFLVLRKIRHNESFQILGDLFGVSRPHAGKIFLTDVEKISDSLRSFIFGSQKQSFKSSEKHKNIKLQCLEITIAKPSKPLDEVLCWSICKQTDTVKYLIGCTADGRIVYISEGFLGKISDSDVVHQCGFSDFNNKNIHEEDYSPAIENIKSEIFSEEVQMNKNSGATSSPTETAIENIRKFAFLQLHSSVLNYKRSYLIDHSVVIASAICNMKNK